MIFWGTYFPLISEAVTGTSPVGPPWFDRYTVPLALVLVLLSGIGPVIAWRRATARQRAPQLPVPLGRALVALVALLVAGVTGSLRDQRCSAAPHSCSAPSARVRPRHDGAAEMARAGRRARRCFRSYGAIAGAMAATSCTSASPVLFVGVAASSSFQHAVELHLSPGSSAPRRRLHGDATFARPRRASRRRTTPAHTGSTLSLQAPSSM